MTDSHPRPPPSPTQRFLGGLLMAVGVLMMVACGLCSLGVMAVFMSEGGRADDFIQGLMAVAVFGGVPALIGLGLFVAGRAMRKP